jgi:hypothetical protein
MIKFSLACEGGHEFESWFPDGASYDEQVKRGFVTCPECHSPRVLKAPMAPAIMTHRAVERPLSGADEKIVKFREAVVALRREIEKRTEDVGQAFPQVARAIHAGDEPERAIRGQANLVEVRALLEEGVRIAPVPALPDEAN